MAWRSYPDAASLILDSYYLRFRVYDLSTVDDEATSSMPPLAEIRTSPFTVYPPKRSGEHRPEV